MNTSPTLAINVETVSQLIHETLSGLGNGQMQSVAYDTAWIARLAAKYPKQGFDEALTWLRKNQNPDGSWGERNFVHHHDRFVCTLAAIIALQIRCENSADLARVRAGERFLWMDFLKLREDPHDTIGFPVLAVALLKEAKARGLDVPRDVFFDPRVVEKKLNQLGSDSRLWSNHTITFSLEGIIRDTVPGEPNFLERNGSVAGSPAATAAVLLYMNQTHQGALNFVQETVMQQGDGGAPVFSPIDTFEIAWAINQLRLAKAITPNTPFVKPLLDVLWNAWEAKRGIGTSTYFSVPDLDDTATSFAVLNWAGYPVSAEVFEFYDKGDHFMCFPNESDPSWSAAIRLLVALHETGQFPKRTEWTNKIINMLHRDDLSGKFLFDKWHVSPYYLRCMAIYALQPVDLVMAEYLVNWLRHTQNEDGGWGYGEHSTGEETAYCLQALLFWDRNVQKIDDTILKAAANYLSEHVFDDQIPALWIGKCLYAPQKVVRASILAALYAFTVRDQ